MSARIPQALETPQPQREPVWRDIFLSISLFSFQVNPVEQVLPHRTHGPTPCWLQPCRFSFKAGFSRLFYTKTEPVGRVCEAAFWFLVSRLLVRRDVSIRVYLNTCSLPGGFLSHGDSRCLQCSDGVHTGCHRAYIPSAAESCPPSPPHPFQYYLSGLLTAARCPYWVLVASLAVIAERVFNIFDATRAGLVVSLATAAFGPLIEVRARQILFPRFQHHDNRTGQNT